MKNLFDYATKELTQDAFLRWLFESWEDKELKDVVQKILGEFCGFECDEVITMLTTRAQEEYIDISVYIDTNKNEKGYALFIEDKVHSLEHEQLKNYNQEITSLANGRSVKKVFYKTSSIYGEERDRIQKASVNDEEWQQYDIHKIYDLFIPFQNRKNLILEQYIKHLEKAKKALSCKTKPTSNNNNLDYLQWESYFHKVGDVLFEKYKASWIGRPGPYPYMCLAIKRAEKEPYIEIQSRNCVAKKGMTSNNPFVARFLFYGIEEGRDIESFSKNVLECQQKIHKEIQKENFKGFSKNYYKKENKPFPRQACFYSAENIDEDKFQAELEKCADWYDELMKIWDETIKN